MGKTVKQPQDSAKEIKSIRGKPIYKRLSFQKNQNNKAETKQICKKFLEDACTLGEKCEYSHVKKQLASMKPKKEFSDNLKSKNDVNKNSAIAGHSGEKEKKKAKSWFNLCFNFQKGKCNFANCRYFHITAEDVDFFQNTGEISLSIIDQAIRNESFFEYNFKKHGSNLKEPCKEFLRGKCSSKTCQFRHITRNKFEKELYEALREEMNNLISSEMQKGIQNSNSQMVDCREEITRKKLLKAAESNKMAEIELINMLANNQGIVDPTAGFNPMLLNNGQEFNNTFGYNMGGPSTQEINLQQELQMEIVRLQERNESLLSELTKANECVNLNKELTSEINHLNEQNKSLLNDLRASNSTLRENQGLRENVEILERKSASFIDHLNGTKNQNRELQRTIEKLQQENISLANMRTSNQMMKLNRELEGEIKNLKMQNQNLMRDLMTSNKAINENNNLKMEIQNLQQQNQRLVNDLKMSKNWEHIYSKDQNTLRELERERNSLLNKIKNLDFEVLTLKGKLKNFEDYKMEIKDMAQKIENQLFFVESATAQLWGGGQPPLQSQRDEWSRLRSMVLQLRSNSPPESYNYNSEQGPSNMMSNYMNPESNVYDSRVSRLQNDNSNYRNLQHVSSNSSNYSNPVMLRNTNAKNSRNPKKKNLGGGPRYGK